ncbi:MAG: hypothetical protein J6A98_03595 [Clostridia bacterium]|nr:hypothetical protein [Clostridia bacterium]
MKRLIFLCKKLFHFGAKPAPKFSQLLVAEILQKVRHNIPEINEKNFANPLKISKPFYVENIKNIGATYAKSLLLANLIFPFELIIFYQNKNDCLALQKFLPQAKFLNQNLISKRLTNQIYSLNVNFAPAPCKLPFEEGIFCGNEKMHYVKVHRFALEEQGKDITLFQTYFNGHFLFFENKNKQKINIFIKKIIYFNKFKYFFLKKENGYCFFDVAIGQKIYIRCNEKIDVDLARTRCGKGYMIEITISAKNANFALYVGKEKINVWDKDLKTKIFALANNQFMHKINSKNKKLEFFFNNFLPREVLKGKIFGKFCKVDISKIFGGAQKILPANLAYLKIKNALVKKEKNCVIFGGENLQNLSFEMLFRGKIKTINFCAGAPKIVVGGVEYRGCKTLANDAFEKIDVVDVFS